MKKTIVAFHIGRGGRFYNAGFLTFIGEKRIGEFTNDLFTRFENENDLLETVENKDRFRDLCVDENFTLLEEEFGVTEEMLGDIEYYCGASMQAVGLTRKEVEEGVGRINIDNDYDTTYTGYLDDCSEEELIAIAKSNEWNKVELLEEYAFKDAEKFHANDRLVEMVEYGLTEWDRKYVICDKTDNNGTPYIAEDLSNTGDVESAWIFDTEEQAQEVIDNANWDWAFVEEV